MKEQKQQSADKIQKRRKIYRMAAVLGLCVAVILTFTPEIGRGYFLHSMLCCYGAAIAFGSYILARLMVRFRPLRAMSTFFMTIAILMVIPFLSVFSGGMLAQYDIACAKRFCEGLVPSLQQYQQENGTYPATIGKVLSRDQKLPLVLRDDGFHYACQGGDSFSFTFVDPGGMMNGWGYDSQDGRWYEWD